MMKLCEHVLVNNVTYFIKYFHSTDSSFKVGVFCLFRLGNQVMDTPTLVEIDRSMVDISFPDMILL